MADIPERRGSGRSAADAGARLSGLLGVLTGAAGRSAGGAAGRLRRIALGLSAIWLIVVAAYAIGLLTGPGPEHTGRPITAVDIALLFLAILAPVTLTLFGLAASAAIARLSEEAAAAKAELAILKQAGDVRAGRGAEQEARKLLTEMQAERAALAEVLREAAARARSGELGHARPEPTPAPAPKAAEKPEPAPAPKPAEARPAPAAESAPKPKPAAAPARNEVAEPPLPLDPPPADARPQLDWEAMVIAMEFPDSETDRRTIEALYKVLPDPMAARLMQSAEDVLSVLAGQGLYIDEMEAAETSAQDWTKYLDGARGAAAAAIGAIKDETALERTRARLKRDGVFNDAALHFLLRYDAIAKRAREETGGDALAPRMAATRSGKAYALIARATGRFDR